MKTMRFVSRALAALALVAVMTSCKKSSTDETPAPTSNLVEIQGFITTNTTWTADKQYLLKGFVKVANGVTLTIQPGTIIKGDKATTGTLIVYRGGMINANGTAANPIIFTSNQAAGSRAPGDWGGVIILGRAKNNFPANATNGTVAGEAAIEGVPLSEGAFHGGTNDADNSGTFRYVRIEFAGVPLATTANSEINGLTMGSVGSATTIEYVQVSDCGDDSFEWFGGSVNCKWLVSLRAVDDDFDMDNGYSGNVQYCLAIRQPTRADQSTSNGLEIDNAPGTGDGANVGDATRFTAAKMANFTMIGFDTPTANSTTANIGRAAHLRRNNKIQIYNSVFAGWANVFQLDGTNTMTNAQNAELKAQGVRVVSTRATAVGSTGTAPGGFDVLTWFDTAADSNSRAENVTNANLATTAGVDAGIFTNTAPVFTVPVGSPLRTNVVAVPTGLTATTYRGAFAPTGAAWTATWTNFNAQNTAY